jgi:hypothetical protein
MRDILTIPFGYEDSLIISSDNSGAIGMKQGDLVHVSYETLAYYSLRVAAMECIAAGGEPISVVLQNFCGDEHWEELVRGIRKGLHELELAQIPITGSTESNFQLNQSAIGLFIVGKQHIRGTNEVYEYNENWKLAVIGVPLVGNEVIEQEQHVVPLSIFQKLCRLKHGIIWPVGSKGILYELNQMFDQVRFTKEQVITELDIVKSSGPATCFIMAYAGDMEEKMKEIAGEYFHAMKIARR